MDQKVEHLRPQRDWIAAAQQFAPFGVKRMVVKAKLHVALRTRPSSRNNQARLRDKSSAGQSLRRALLASCVNHSRDPADDGCHNPNHSLPLPESNMTQIQTINPGVPGNRTLKFIAFLYGLVAYLTFFVAFLYAIGFVGGFVVPKTIDTGSESSATEAVVVNLLLMSLFAVQHSVMARQQFKQWWTRYVPKPVERSTYVLLASLCLLLLFWQWRPMPAIVWQIDDPDAAVTVATVSLGGWIIVLTSTFMINHFELFGLHQVTNHLTDREMPAARFRTPLYYKLVRHPIYLGFIIAFWAAPVMTVGHLLFAAVTTAYILVGIFLEERDLIALFGDEYRQYRKQVSMLLPWRKSI
jgi:protein-S-isoprenylcysteine O-methyltransferase Ste14